MATSMSSLCYRLGYLGLTSSTSAVKFSKFHLGIRQIGTSTSLNFYSSPILCAEPLKKKKRIDPAVVRMREERKKRRIEKSIRRLQKNSLQLKPVEELVPDRKLIKEKTLRTRTVPELPFEESESRALLEKEWCRYKCEQHLSEIQAIDRLIMSQQKALDELKSESLTLYQQAVQVDPSLMPCTRHGPVHTPPIDKYEAPDGEYVDITRKWV